MKILLAFIFLFTVNAFAVAPDEPLVFADGTLLAHISWIKGPRTPAVSEMKIEWTNGTDLARLEPPGPFKVSLFMNMHGHQHGSSPVTITPLEAGLFLASDMYFTMDGDWEVRVTLALPNGRYETKALPVNVPTGAQHQH